MKSAGIICEYDPFHKGHEYQIKQLRNNGADTVVCLMSGNATQRGGIAVADKYTRAFAALSSGADLVLELPFPYSSASAEFFAAAGVCLLDSLGVDELNFGSECGNIGDLTMIAEITATPEFDSEYRRILGSDPTVGTARAYAEAYKNLSGKAFSCGPNDILALSYIKAALRASSELCLTTIKRAGSGFSDTELKANVYPSATALRCAFANGEYDKAFNGMPSGSIEAYKQAAEQGIFPSDISKLDSVMLSFFRLCNPRGLENIAEASGGIAGRLISSARHATGFDEMLANASTKRYTDARLRRAALFCLLGVTYDDLRLTPAYTTLLAADRRGREFLSEHRNCGVTIVTKPSDAPACRQRELSERLDSLFVQTLPKPLAADEFLRRSPKISEND